MAYTPPDGGAIHFDLHGDYTPPDGGAIVFPLVPYVEPPVVLEYAESPDFGVPWGQMPVMDDRTAAGWTERRQLSTRFGMGWSRQQAMARKLDAPWLDKKATETARAIPWADRETSLDETTQSPWVHPGPSDHKRALPHGDMLATESAYSLAHIAPPARDDSVAMGYGALAMLDLIALDFPWGNPPQKDRLHKTLWGKKYYREICWRAYEPPEGGNIRLNLDMPITLVDDGDHIHFIMDQLTYDRRCDQREPSGWRDAYFYRPPGLVPTGLVKDFYMVMNTAYLTRLPERTAIDVRSMTMAIDLESYCWTFSATIGSETSLDLLRPTSVGPMLVEASVNGHIWVMQIDSWRQGRSFGGGDRSVSGRSVSAQLGSPAAELTSYTETQARTANQLAEAALVGTGFTLVWDCVDWLVPANCLSYQDQTPIQVVQAVAGAVGAVVQTHQETKTLTVQSRYNGSPWTWAVATPDLILPESLCVGVDGEWDARPVLNAAFVAGTVTGGISAKVIRQGTAGDLAAQMVTDALITHADAGRERGRCIMAAGGDWNSGKIELPLFATPDVPGVVLPGQILRIVPPVLASWQCQTTGLTVSVSWESGGLKVRQMVDYERYHGA
ncbi:MAG: hypothetical protein JZU65_08540 [Chlorobium sp.]|nr:hypothetical protein [Chlorobium sp.]